MRLVTVAGVMALGIPEPAHSQEPPFKSFHGWVDLTTIYNFNDRLRYDGDYGVQGLLTDRYWTQVWVRPSIRYRVGSASLHLGTGLIYNFLDDEYDLPEIRPVVGLQLQGPRLGRFAFRHFARLELRNLYLASGSDWDTRVRGRYQLQLTSPDFRIGGAEDYFALASVELFDNFGSSNTDFIGDRFRFVVGLGKRDVSTWRITVQYMFHKVRVPDSGQRLTFELDDHMVRLRLARAFG